VPSHFNCPLLLLLRRRLIRLQLLLLAVLLLLLFILLLLLPLLPPLLLLLVLPLLLLLVLLLLLLLVVVVAVATAAVFAVPVANVAVAVNNCVNNVRMKLSSVSKHHDIYILHGVKSQALQTLNIVDSFAELRKATIIVFMSVRLSA